MKDSAPHAPVGASEGLVRVSVGIEVIDDILDDIDAGLRSAQKD